MWIGEMTENILENIFEEIKNLLVDGIIHSIVGHI